MSIFWLQLIDIYENLDWKMSGMWWRMNADASSDPLLSLLNWRNDDTLNDSNRDCASMKLTAMKQREERRSFLAVHNVNEPPHWDDSL